MMRITFPISFYFCNYYSHRLFEGRLKEYIPAPTDRPFLAFAICQKRPSYHACACPVGVCGQWEPVVHRKLKGNSRLARHRQDGQVTNRTRWPSEPRDLTQLFPPLFQGGWRMLEASFWYNLGKGLVLQTQGHCIRGQGTRSMRQTKG